MKWLPFLTLVITTFPLFAEESGNAAAAEAQTFVGSWQRTDGPYLLKVLKVDGVAAQVEYFNPNPIHVASASVEKEEGIWTLKVVLQDAGYDGSHYALVCDPETGNLIGRYTLGVDGQVYDVIFVPAEE